MGELRHVLGVLREEQDGEGLLNRQSRVRDQAPVGSGLTVTCRTVGDLDAPGSGVQLAIRRTAQEARTNTLKHAGTDSAPPR